MKTLLTLLISMTLALTTANQSIAQTTDAKMQAKYEKLLDERDALAAEISRMNTEMSLAKKSKAKKIGKQLVDVQQKYDAAMRSIASFPKSITNPESQQEAQNRDTEEFRREMARKLEEKLAGMDMDKVVTADVEDAELKRAYENYQRNGDVATPAVPQADIYFTVQVAAGRSGGNSSLKNITNLIEVKQDNGNSYYCVGKYRSETEAKEACTKLRKTTKHKDAFVVAFYGNLKITVAEAERLKK